MIVLHPLQIEAIDQYRAKYKADLRADRLIWYRQRQQRRRKHGRSGRFDREELWFQYLRQETGLRCGK